MVVRVHVECLELVVNVLDEQLPIAKTLYAMIYTLNHEHG